MRSRRTRPQLGFAIRFDSTTDTFQLVAVRPKETNMSQNTRYVVKTPVQIDEDRTVWRAIGSAWINPPKGNKPQCISIALDALPLGGTLRCWPAEQDESAAASGPLLPPPLDDDE